MFSIGTLYRQQRNSYGRIICRIVWYRHNTTRELLWANNLPHCETTRKDNTNKKFTGNSNVKSQRSVEKLEDRLNSSNIWVFSGTATCVYLRPGLDNHYKGNVHHSLMILLMVVFPYYKFIIVWPGSVAGVWQVNIEYSPIRYPAKTNKVWQLNSEDLQI